MHYAHMEMPHVCTVCPEKFPYLDMLQCHAKETHDTRFTCSTCGMVFVSMQGLKKHEIRHTGQKPFECEKCNFKSACQTSLVQHKKRFHCEVNARTHVCHECGKGFFTRYNLKEHLFTHSDIKRFSCEMCGRMLKNDSCYRRHMVCVHGQKVTCDVCGKDFSSPVGLKSHKNKVHDIV